MKSLALVASALIVLVGFDKSEAKLPTVKEIMQKLHGGRDGLRTKLSKDLRAEKPDWKVIQKDTQEIVKFAEALGKNEPPQGERQSWDKLTGQYVASAKAMDAAAEKQDPAAIKTAYAKMGSSCTNCHNAHRPRQ
jgi:cytochrome c556